MSDPIRFHVENTVKWNESAFPTMVGSMKEQYGEGPFTVVGVRLHTKAARERSPDAHPEAVTIELPNEQRQEFDGAWFVKV